MPIALPFPSTNSTKKTGHQTVAKLPRSAVAAELRRFLTDVHIAKSFVEGTSVARLAREFNINANQVCNCRKQFSDLQGTKNENPPATLLPVTVMDMPAAAEEHALPTPGVIVLRVGAAQLRLEGSVDTATLAQVLARLLP